MQKILHKVKYLTAMNKHKGKCLRFCGRVNRIQRRTRSDSQGSTRANVHNSAFLSLQHSWQNSSSNLRSTLHINLNQIIQQYFVYFMKELCIRIPIRNILIKMPISSPSIASLILSTPSSRSPLKSTTTLLSGFLHT